MLINKSKGLVKVGVGFVTLRVVTADSTIKVYLGEATTSGFPITTANGLLEISTSYTTPIYISTESETNVNVGILNAKLTLPGTEGAMTLPITIADVTGLQAILDAKLDDTATIIAGTGITVTGTDLGSGLTISTP